MNLKSQLTANHIEDFWIKVYFDLSEGYKIAAIKRAYRDFSRTLENFPKNESQKNSLKTNWINVLEKKVEELLSTQFINQEEFTTWHQSTCFQLRTINSNYPLTQGQAQKWINMILKYLFALGETRISGITNNYQYFHVPIDNIIMNKLQENGIDKFDMAWSKIKDYNTYHEYQVKIRNMYKNQIPMDVEFMLFNEPLQNIKARIKVLMSPLEEVKATTEKNNTP
jgi:hypothetical protein